MQKQEKEKLIAAWFAASVDDLQTAIELFSLKRHSACLFFCHLSIEKILKAIFLKKHDTYPPPIHNLLRLAKLSSLILDHEEQVLLVEMNTFNVEARYDILKEALYKKADNAYTKNYLDKAKQLIDIFKKEL
jgi:HEPN domain-containing protein